MASADDPLAEVFQASSCSRLVRPSELAEMDARQDARRFPEARPSTPHRWSIDERLCSTERYHSLPPSATRVYHGPLIREGHADGNPVGDARPDLGLAGRDTGLAVYDATCTAY